MSLIYCILTFFFICLYASRINRKNIIIFPLLIILVTSILYFSDLNRFKETMDHSYKQLFPKSKLFFFSEQHQVFAITSIKLFKNNLILGIGPNNYRRKCNEISSDIFFKKSAYKSKSK